MTSTAPPPPIAPGQINLDFLGNAVLCFSETIYRTNGVWEGPDPLAPVIPLFILQIVVAIFLSRLFNYALKPFNQPPLVAEIISGIVLGPSLLGRLTDFRITLFPNYYFHITETMAHFGLVLFAFITGLQMDTKALWHTGTRSKVVAATGIVFPFLVGVVFFYIFNTDESKGAGYLYCGGALTVTGFSVLAKILDSQKILNTEIGKIAVSSAIINEASSWFFLIVAVVATGNPNFIIWSVVSTVIYLLLSAYYVKPCLEWIVKKTPEGQGLSEFYVCSVLVGISLSGVFADAIGTHPVIGAFIFGLTVPNQVLGQAVLDRMEDFVMGIFMPMFYVVCGLRTNVDIMADGTNAFVVILVILMVCTAKIIGALAASFVTGMSTGEAIGVGVLTNTKSFMVLVILEIGQLDAVLTPQIYTILVISSLLMTILVTPMTNMFRPTQDMMPYKRRTFQNANPEEELRILSCIHAPSNVPSIISLLESSNSSKTSPIAAYAVQLLDVVGRAPAMLVSDSARLSAGMKNMSQEEEKTTQIINAFDNYELRSQGVTTQVLTCRSNFDTMPEDICKLAREKRASFLILPFHKEQGADGDMEDINPAIQSVNEEVLMSAPCSVGILIDRGRSDRSTEGAKNIVMLFQGGPDDREALTYAWRMSELPDVNLTVLRFIPGKDVSLDEFDPDFELTREKSFVSISIDADRDKEMDEEFLTNFKTAVADEPSVTYLELVLDDEEEMIKAIKSLDSRNFDLYVVGRGRGVSSPLTAGLADWAECPELGAVGDLLVTSEFESSFSVLVLQQYLRSNKNSGGSIISAESISERMDSEMQMEIGFRLSVGDADAAYESSASSFSRRPGSSYNGTSYNGMLDRPMSSQS